MSGETILIWLVVGLVAGWLASAAVGGGLGVAGDIVIGIVGAFIASWLFPKLGIQIAASSLVREILYATIGAILLLVVLRLVRRGGRW